MGIEERSHEHKGEITWIWSRDHMGIEGRSLGQIGRDHVGMEAHGQLEGW